MYIISKKSEKDYYDGVAGTTGIDKTIVYERHILEVEDSDIPKIFKRKQFIHSKNSDGILSKLSHLNVKKEYQKEYPLVSSFIIGFCGKLYPGWKLYSEKKTDHYPFNEMVTEFTYDADLVVKIVNQLFHWGPSFDDNVKYVKEYDAMELFRLFNAPVFVYDYDYNRTQIEYHWRSQPSKFLINPLLKEYEFYKVFDSFQAFQEISMFIGGVLGNREKDIVEVADKYKIAQHGFDKWSFRKPPENK